mgnify:CR=1 FL=1
MSMENGMDTGTRRKQAELAAQRLTAERFAELLCLENAFRQSVGEEPLSPEMAQRLEAAVRGERIRFLALMDGPRAVGLCSVSPAFSTYGCAPCALFDDFYIDPAYRKTGAARALANAAFALCRELGIESLFVGCAPCDSAMYRSLGFDTALGSMRAWNG